MYVRVRVDPGGGSEGGVEGDVKGAALAAAALGPVRAPGCRRHHNAWLVRAGWHSAQVHHR